MAYILQTNAYGANNQSETMLLLSALQNIATLTAPVSIANMRAQLETGQPDTFTDAAFNQYLQRLYDLPLDFASMTAAEFTIRNTMREHLSPAPSFSCCGGTEYPGADTDYTFTLTQKAGSTTDYILTVDLNTLFSCDVYELEAVKTAGSIAQTPATITADKLGCEAGKQRFIFSPVVFSSDPTGTGDYTFDVTAKDSAGATVGTTAAITISL